jgi:SNF2 family DNA or RNA helicase
LPEAVEVRGSDSESEKERKLSAFSTGEERLLITKPSIAGLGMNWQHCQRMIFHSISFSWESYYQAVRRCWRFGQTKPVDVHVILAECDDILEKAIANKANDHELMRSGMSEAMLDSMRESLFQEVRQERYRPMETVEIPNWLNKTKKVTKEKVRS